MRILHVEDNDDTRTLVAFVLQAEGWEVLSVDSAEVALRHATDGGFNLYLIDHWIDGNTGSTLCSDLRSVDQNTPILFYSGAMLDDEAVQASGAQGFVEKPCSPEKLVAEITRLTKK
jgi:two-component system, OmpR family, response regulator ResD